MAMQVMTLNPLAFAGDGDALIAAINDVGTTEVIDRASCVAAAARPIGEGEVVNSMLAVTAIHDNLDAMADAARGYLKTDPGEGEFPVYSIEIDATSQLKVDWDDGES
jgi:hypothetical protein